MKKSQGVGMVVRKDYRKNKLKGIGKRYKTHLIKMKIALIGDEKYENRGELKETIFKLKEKFGEDLTIITRGKKNGVEKWVRKYALEMNLKYIEFNPAHTSRTLYSGMEDEYYDKPYHPTQPLHQYDCIVHNSDKIVYFGEIKRKEFNHFSRLLNRWKKKASFVQ
tara:strand:- start:550 stop:1044 length:495 start_codon:yes stop_codon:yes gene_type:complete